MVLVEKWPFFQLLFLGNIGQENVFYYILERKEAFLGYKNKNFKKSKNGHFSKCPWFWSKNGHFSNFYFWEIQARKMSFTIFQSKKTPFQAIKTRSTKSGKIDIFPKGLTYGFGPKIAIFRTFFFQEIQDRKISFTIFQIGEKPFQAIKTRSSKNGNIDIFPKGLTHGFGPKMAIFFNFFFQAIQARKMSFTICQSIKDAFLGYKNKKFKRSKIVHFSKAVNPWFWSKNGHLFNFFFGQYRPEIYLLRYSRAKRSLSRL